MWSLSASVNPTRPLFEKFLLFSLFSPLYKVPSSWVWIYFKINRPLAPPLSRSDIYRMMVRLKRGNFIALLLFLFPPRRHSGRCVITGDLLPPCERLSSPTSPGSNYSSTQGLVGHECVYMAEFSGVFLTPLLPLLLLLWFRTRQIPSSCEFLHRLEFSLNNRTLNTITHTGHWLMLVFIVYYYGFILRAGLEQVDLSAVYTLAVVLI